MKLLMIKFDQDTEVEMPWYLPTQQGTPTCLAERKQLHKYLRVPMKRGTSTGKLGHKCTPRKIQPSKNHLIYADKNYVNYSPKINQETQLWENNTAKMHGE